MNIPENLTRNSHFQRYYRTWQKNPLSVVFVPLAQICRDHGYLQEAQEICEAGLKHNPDSVSGRLTLANVLYAKGDLQKVEEITESILTTYPTQSEARSLLVNVQKDLQQLRGVGGRGSSPDSTEHPAQPVFCEDDEVTLKEEKAEKNTNLWENVTMAQIYADQGEMKIARDILHRILKRRPQDEKAQALLAKMGVV